jgi:hypothetical protein
MKVCPDNVYRIYDAVVGHNKQSLGRCGTGHFWMTGNLLLDAISQILEILGLQFGKTAEPTEGEKHHHSSHIHAHFHQICCFQSFLVALKARRKHPE